MVRPCFLVLDPEHPGSISTRKLVIETAKFNVITSYTAQEALDTLRRFPALDGAVLDARIENESATALIREMRKVKQKLPIVVISAPGTPRPHDADYVVDSLSPGSLLQVLQEICPQETVEIEQHDRKLEAEGQ